MKERPILFSAPMVRAILDGRKTQTRRVVKHGQVFRFVPGGDLSREERQAMYASPFQWDHCNPVHPTVDELLSCCPYGVPGDRLWVREKVGHTTSVHGACVIWYAADGAVHHTLATDGGEGDLCGVGPRAKKMEVMPVTKCTPSIHMPRWASRITIEVVSVRVERLQKISEADAKAEGCGIELEPHQMTQHAAQNQYMRLWDSINGTESWAANPWVWVVEFKRMENNQ